MPTIPTVAAMQARAITEVQTRNPRLTDTAEGSVVDGLTGAGAVLADESIRLFLAGQARFYFDTATGTELDALAADRGFPPRVPASGALGEYQWTKGDPGAAYTLPAGHRVQGTLDDGTPVVVESTASTVVLAVDSTVSVVARAQDTGLSTNLAAGFLTSAVDVIPSDPSATVTNAARFVGGAPAETDERYRARLRLVYSTLRRGTLAALEFGALSVPGVSIVTVDETFLSVDQMVRVYIGDPDARSNTLLAQMVETEMENWRAAGVRLVVVGADRQEIGISLTVTVPAGTDTAAVGQDIRSNLLGYTDNLAPGQILRTSEVLHRVHEASALVLSASLPAGSTDQTPALVQDALRVNESAISLTWVEI